jgi:hypothetical protein
MKYRLLSVNAWQLASTRCLGAAAGSGKFKKLVYDSTFMKCPAGIRFVNVCPDAFPRAKQNRTLEAVTEAFFSLWFLRKAT